MSRISGWCVPTTKLGKWTTREHAPYWRLQWNWIHRASVANWSYWHDVRFDGYWQRSIIGLDLPRSSLCSVRLTPVLLEWQRRWNLNGWVAKRSNKYKNLYSWHTCLESQPSAHYFSPVHLRDNEIYLTYKTFKIPAKLFPVSFINIISSVFNTIRRAVALSAVLNSLPNHMEQNPSSSGKK